MKGLKKLALASAVLAVSTGAFAMEALQDDDLSATTGQAGLTITTSGTSITASQVRYYDSDGTTGAATALGLTSSIYLTKDGTSTGTAIPDAGGGACAGAALAACANSFTVGGALNINNFSLTELGSTTTLDIGSTGTGAGAVSGLLVGISAANLTVGLGGISVDNGDELNGAITGSRAATNAPVYSGTTGLLTSGNDLGGVALSSITLPQSVLLITAGAPELNAALHSTAFDSGLTITSLQPITSLTLTAYYYNTSLQSYSASGGFTAATGLTAGKDGVVALPIDLFGILSGPTEIGVGLAGGGYGTTAGQGLQVLTTGTNITAVDLGGEALGGTGIQIAGTDVGSVGILGLKIGGNLMSISGH